jgi:hypothetical protein
LAWLTIENELRFGNAGAALIGIELLEEPCDLLNSFSIVTTQTK